MDMPAAVPARATVSGRRFGVGACPGEGVVARAADTATRALGRCQSVSPPVWRGRVQQAMTNGTVSETARAVCDRQLPLPTPHQVLHRPELADDLVSGLLAGQTHRIRSSTVLMWRGRGSGPTRWPQ
ncbi:hypothetical protein LV79_002594 [Actinokineospora globicatena]|nr:hypothetical protein [Actinokineospora globicatena]